MWTGELNESDQEGQRSSLADSGCNGGRQCVKERRRAV